MLGPDFNSWGVETRRGSISPLRRTAPFHVHVRQWAAHPGPRGFRMRSGCDATTTCAPDGSARASRLLCQDGRTCRAALQLGPVAHASAACGCDAAVPRVIGRGCLRVRPRPLRLPQRLQCAGAARGGHTVSRAVATYTWHGARSSMLDAQKRHKTHPFPRHALWIWWPHW